MKRKFYIGVLTAVAASVFLFPSCGGSGDGVSYSGHDSEYSDGSEYDDEDESPDFQTVEFNSSNDVYRYLDGKTFTADDGSSVRFYNYGRAVDMNGLNLSNDVTILDFGINDNDVAYATVRVFYPTNTITTLSLLAVEEHAQLLDPNDGTVYTY